MLEARKVPADTLRSVTRWVAGQLESIVQRYTIAQLVRLYECDRAAEYAFPLTRWEPDQIDEAARLGLIPEWREDSYGRIESWYPVTRRRVITEFDGGSS